MTNIKIYVMKNRFFVFVLLALIFILIGCSKFSQKTVLSSNQVNFFELLNGIRDKADVEGSGILEYELYDVPCSEFSDFQMFIRNYTQTHGEYAFDHASKYRIEDNTALSINVKTLMAKHKRNISITQIVDPDGSITFIFNCLNNNGKYEYYSILAYKNNMSGTPKTTENFIRHDFAEAYIRRGWTYYWEEDYDKAIKDFTEAIRLEKGNTEAYSTRGMAYCWKEDYESAILDFTELIRLEPKNAYAYNSRGMAYYWKDEYDKAITDYTKAIMLYPKLADAYIWRGRVYYWKKDYDRAIADYNQAIQLDQNDALTFYFRGNAYHDKGDYDQAIADYEEALRIDPDDDDIRQELEDAKQQLQSAKSEGEQR